LIRAGTGTRRHHGDAVANADFQLIGEHPTEDDPILSRLEVGKLALAHRTGQGRYLRLHLRIDAAYHGTAHIRRTAQHGVGVEVRGSTDQLLGAVESAYDLAPVRDRRTAGVETSMRRCAQQAVAKLRAETVHDRQHHDQYRNAQCHARQGHPGDERNEKTVLTGQRIAQAHENWNGLKHARRLNHSWLGRCDQSVKLVTN
jgi:hypothetical protein